MGTTRNRIASTVGLLAFLMFLAVYSQDPPGEYRHQQTVPGTRLVEEIPIQGLLKVVTETGEVIFISKNRRFVFRGQMTDLWQGEAMGVASTQDRIDLDRNGVDAESISVSVGKGDRLLTVFVAPECETCAALVEMMLKKDILSRHRYRVVMLSSSVEGELSNRLVWCSEKPDEALRDIYIDGVVPTSLKSPASDCNQFGLFLAQQAALAFGIAQLPTMATEDGSAVVGIEGAIQTLGIGEQR